MLVLKFGGSSVQTPDRIERVAEIVKAAKAKDSSLAVIVSAFGGVTENLISLGKVAITGDEGYKQQLEELQTRHIEALKHLVPVADQSAQLLQLKLWFNDLEDVIHGVFLVGELSARCLDYIMSFGELFSALIVAAALRARGVDAQFLDARSIIRADTSFGAGKVDFKKSNELISKHFEKQKALQVVTGFIAATENNDTITLGRGGSDYSASIIGAALNAKEVEIWTDVDGMLTADPRKVPKAFSQLGVTYEEAMELSHFGAKVIYPPTMQPALERKIPIRIKNTFNPGHVGTVVGVESAEGKRSVTGITSIDQVALLRLEGSGMVGVAGTSMRLFSALAEAKINVILITQASSEHTICFAVRPEDAKRAKAAVDNQFQLELSTGVIDPCVLELEMSIVSVVGEKMRSTPGIAGRVFAAMGRNGVNIVAIAQGSSEINISAVIGRSDEIKALNALHEEFFLP